MSVVFFKRDFLQSFSLSILQVYRREFQPEFEFFIHDLEPNTSHTLQIIGKIKSKSLFDQDKNIL